MKSKPFRLPAGQLKGIELVPVARLLSFLTGGCWTFTLFLFFLQGQIISKRKLAIALALWLIFAILLTPLFQRFLLPWLRQLTARQRLSAAIFSLAAGFLLIPALPLEVPPNLLLAPQRRLAIIAAGDKNPASSGAVVEIHWIDTGVYALSFNALQSEGNWQPSEGGLVFDGAGQARLSWQGPTLENTDILFNTRPDGGIVEVIWDDKRQVIDLYNPAAAVIHVHEELPFPAIVRVSSILLTGVSLSSLVFAALVGLAATPPRRKPAAGLKRVWLALALPMWAGWSVYLLTFWPAIMSPDSTNQWGQVLTGKFFDYHPIAHTLTLWLITRLWLSPAAVALAQILALSLVIAAGLGMLERYGLPRWASWLVSVLFALSPVMGSMSVTLLKDVFYSAAFLALALMLLKATLSQYTWLKSGANWILPGLAAGLMALYRHNGFPVALGALVLLALLSWKQTRKALLSILLMLALWFGVRQAAIWITGSPSGLALADTPILHHFGAHVAAGTPLTDEERAYLNAVLPLDAPWPYRCFSINSIYNHPEFDAKRFAANPQLNRRIFLDLLRRAPQVDLDHWLCSSGLVWKIRATGSYMAGDSLVLKDGNVMWIEPGPFSPPQASILPGLAPALAWLIRAPQENLAVEAILWRPATYLYLHLFCTIALAIRFRSWRQTLFASPAALQSGLLLLVNFAQDFRYQFPVYMLGIFSLALLFLPPPVEDTPPEGL
ncbi:MAG: hypothetical protein HPY59_03300 [Anaerolineae bacterium]|nr:hypothetical protein [Anaerolineae bacterium]